MDIRVYKSIIAMLMDVMDEHQWDDVLTPNQLHIGVETDGLIVRCIPLQPINKKKEVNLSELFGLDKTKEIEKI